MKKILTILLLSLALLYPVAARAQAPALDYSGFVKCDGVPERNINKDTGKDLGPKAGEEQRQEKCDFAALVNTIVKAINWMFIISIPVATTLFAYGGLLYMTGQKGKIDTAKKIFTSVGIGFIIMIVAWVSVRTIVDWFVDPASSATILVK